MTTNQILEILGIILRMKEITTNLQELVIFEVTIILNIKAKALEKHYQFKNIFIKLGHT